MALMVPPTHPCPPFDNVLVRKGKSGAFAVAQAGCAGFADLDRNSRVVATITAVDVVGACAMVRAFGAITVSGLIGTIWVELLEIIEIR